MGCTESLALGNDKHQQNNRQARKHSRQVSLTHHQSSSSTNTVKPYSNRNGAKQHSRHHDIRHQHQLLGSGLLSEEEEDGEFGETSYPSVARLRGRRGKHWLQQHAPPAHSHVIAEPRSPPDVTTPRVAMDTSTTLHSSADLLRFSKTELGTPSEEILPSATLHRRSHRSQSVHEGIQSAPSLILAPTLSSNPLMPPTSPEQQQRQHSAPSSPNHQHHCSVSWNPTDIGGRAAKQLYAGGGGRTNSSSSNRSTPGPTNTACTSPNINSKPPLAPTPTQPSHHHHAAAAAAAAGNIDFFIPTPTDINSDGIPTPIQQQQQNNQCNYIHPHNSHRSTDTGLAAVMATSFNSIGNRSRNREVGGIPLVPGLPRSVLQSTGTSSAIVSNNNATMSGSLSMRPSGLFNSPSNIGVQRRGRYERIRGWLDVIDDDTYHHTTASQPQHHLPAVSVWITS